jgi:DNA polymerase-4/DNA polymerase V
MAARVKRDLETELGMTFSLGLSATKTLAKIGSKWRKPSRLTAISLKDAPQYLRQIPAGAVWGIGPNTSAYLAKYGVRTALDFAKKDEVWVRARLSKPFVETWRELNGEAAYELDTAGRATYQSISKTKTFTPPSSDPTFVLSQLSKNVENACIKARRWKLASTRIFFFLKTQDFQYRGCEVRLPRATALPHELLRAIKMHVPSVWRGGLAYRATGIILLDLVGDADTQLDLFGAAEESRAVARVYERMDEIAEKYGKHAVFLGSSWKAMTYAAHAGDRGDIAKRATTLFKGETARRRLGVPMLGEVG